MLEDLFQFTLLNEVKIDNKLQVLFYEKKKC